MFPHRILSKIINRPLLLDPETAALVYSVVAERSGGMFEPLVQPGANRLEGEAVYDPKVGPVYRRHGSTAVIPIMGELVNRGAWVGANSGLTSYEGIARQLKAAVADDAVYDILLDIESPGGEATGAFELADAIRAADAVKPVYSFANGYALSAGYAAASAARRIYTTPTGSAGSIGVVLLHVDRSKELEKRGIKPTLIYEGAHKVDANPFEPLSEAVEQDLQEGVREFYSLFVSAVAKGRRGMDEEAIRSTEARTYHGQKAVDAGLVDSVVPGFDSVLADISARRAVRPITNRSTRSSSMSNNEGDTAARNAETVAKADHDRAVSSARTDGEAAGRLAALADVKAITEHEEAQGREAQALRLALSGMKPDAAADLLKTFPRSSSIAERASKSGVDQIDTGAGAAAPKTDGDKRKLSDTVSKMYGKRAS